MPHRWRISFCCTATYALISFTPTGLRRRVLALLAKAFPNVVMNFCWAHAIDPLYCQALMRGAVSAVPRQSPCLWRRLWWLGLPPGGGYVDRARPICSLRWQHGDCPLRPGRNELPELSRLSQLPGPGSTRIQRNLSFGRLASRRSRITTCIQLQQRQLILRYGFARCSHQRTDRSLCY